MATRRSFGVMAAFAAVLLVVAAVLGFSGWRARGEGGGAVPAGARPALPDRIGAPLWGGADQNDRPIGAASVLFGNSGWYYDTLRGDMALVGFDRDTYRFFYDHDNDSEPASQALLSPDGGRVALVDRVLNLRTDVSTALPRFGSGWVVPQAWAPDGRLAMLVERDAQPPDADNPPPVRPVDLVVADADMAHYRTVATWDSTDAVDGFTAAFAADGRLAYQRDGQVVVEAVDGTVLHQFPGPRGSRLAGKGAWTPDGRGLTLLTQRRCCTGDAYPSRWTLSVVDAATGAPLDRPTLPEVRGVAAVRLLGWAQGGPNTGAAIAVAYTATDTTYGVPGFYTNRGKPGASDEDITDSSAIDGANLVALTPAGVRTVLSAHNVAGDIDVADDVVTAGTIRTGHPPTGLGPYSYYLLALAPLGAAALVATFLLITAIRRRRTATRTDATWSREPLSLPT